MRRYFAQWATLLVIPLPGGFGFSPARGFASISLPKPKAALDADKRKRRTHCMTQEEETQRGHSTRVVFPVISKIAGVEWTGGCRYVDANLKHATNLKLSGGVKYDIDGRKLTLSSYLTFPNGKERQVVMRGERNSDGGAEDSNVVTLGPAEGDGPIVMRVSEIAPDTILINEIERASGKIIMTSSVSVVQTPRGTELVGVSHEVGDTAGGDGDAAIEGHQIWRMVGGPASKGEDLSF